MSMSWPPPPEPGSALPSPPGPPPAGSSPLGRPPSAPTRPFRSGRTLANVLRALLLAVIAVTGFDAAANLDAAQLLDQLQADASSVSLADLKTSDSRTDAAALVQFVLLAVAFGFLVAWTSRLYRNLRSIGVQGLRFTEGWAIGAWFIPFFNLVRPKQILNDIWRGSGPSEGVDWRTRPVTPVLHWWWGMWILSAIVTWGSFGDPTDLDAARWSAIRAVLGDVAIVVAAVLEIVAITRLTDRQEHMAGRAATRRLGRWVPAALLSPLLGIAVFGIALAVFSAADEEEAAGSADTGSTGTDPAPEPAVGGRTVFALDLRTGDCFDRPSERSPAEDVVEIVAVEVVDCATLHDEEVVARLLHSAGEDADFPGDEALVAYTERVCVSEFDQFVGRSYAESELVLNSIWPASEAWEDGDRMILCIASLPDDERLVGTVRDSGR